MMWLFTCFLYLIIDEHRIDISPPARFPCVMRRLWKCLNRAGDICRPPRYHCNFFSVLRSMLQLGQASVCMACFIVDHFIATRSSLLNHNPLEKNCMDKTPQTQPPLDKTKSDLAHQTKLLLECSCRRNHTTFAMTVMIGTSQYTHPPASDVRSKIY